MTSTKKEDNKTDIEIGQPSTKNGADYWAGKEKEVFFLSAQRYYTLAIHIIIAFSIYTGVKYGTTFGEIMGEGTWFVLGGFSLWYVLSALTLPFAAIMFLYVLLTRRWIRISGKGENLTFHERYLYLRKSHTEIPKNQIVSIKLSEGYLGVKYLWILPFGIHMIYVLTDGIMLLSNPHTFELGIVNAWMLIASGVVDFIVLLFILIPGKNQLEIRTNSEIFRLKYCTWAHNKDLNLEIREILGLKAPILEKDQENLETDYKKKEPESITNRTLNDQIVQEKIFLSKQILLGALCIIIALWSRAFNRFAGAPVRVLLYLNGIVFIVSSLKTEPNTESRARRTQILTKNRTNTLLLEKDGVSSRNTIRLYGLNPRDPERVYFDLKAKKVNFLEAALVPLLSLVLGWSMSAWFRFLPSNNDLQVDSTIIGAVTLILVVVLIDLVIYPQFVLHYDHKQQATKIELSQVKIRSLMDKYHIKPAPAVSWLHIMKILWEKDKKTVLYRLGIVLGAFVIGIVMGIL